MRPLWARRGPPICACMSRTLSVFTYPRFGRAAVLATLTAGLALVAAGPAAAHHVSGRPHMPQNLRVVTTTSTTVTIAWSRTARKFYLFKNGNRVASTTRLRHTFRNLDCDRGYRFGVRAVGKNGLSTVAARWVHTGACASDPVAPVNLERPDISGNAREGDVLVSTDGEWAGWGPFSYTHRWLRCNAQGQDCNP